MDIITVFNKLDRFERALMTLYDKYSAKFKKDREVSGFFYNLSLDEKAHSELIQYQRRMVKKSPRDFKDVEADVEAIEAILAEVNDAISNVDAVSFEDAVRFTVKVENSEIETYYRYLMEQSNPEAARLLTMMGVESNDHTEGVMSFALKHGLLDSDDMDLE